MYSLILFEYFVFNNCANLVLLMSILSKISKGKICKYKYIYT